MTSCKAWNAILMLVGAAALAGCNPYQYVNIPPEPGDWARHGPNSDVVRDVEVAAIEALLADEPIDGQYRVQFPQGTSTVTKLAIAERLGSGMIGPEDVGQVAPAATLHVKAIRVRGTSAEVDIARSVGDGPAPLKTVHLEYTPFGGWSVERIQDWGVIEDPSMQRTAAPPEAP